MRTMPNSDNRYYKHSLFGSRRDFLKLAAVAGSLPIPVHVATGEADLAAELKRGLAYVRIAFICCLR